MILPSQFGAAGHHFHSHHVLHLCLFRGYLSSCSDSLFCPALLSLCHHLHAFPASVVPELWFLTACQQHTLCPCHLSPITPAAATCSGALPTSPLLPSVLAMLLRGRKDFFLISGCCWTVTQLNSDIWEISCHLSLRWCTTLTAAKIFNHKDLRSVVFTVLRTFSFSGFLRTVTSTKIKSVN